MKHEPVLVADDVAVNFGGLRALDGVHVAVDRGSTVALIGPNGAGKSTLLDVLSGFRRAERGEVLLAGRSLGKIGPTGRARLGMARTFQQVAMFSELTVWEHLCLGALARRRRQQQAVIRRMTRRNVMEALIERDDSPVGVPRLLSRLNLKDVQHEQVGTLPLGMARLVDLGRAIAAEPEVLLLDEPVSGLDRGDSASIAALLRELAADLSMSALVVEHDLEFAQATADVIIAMNFGRVIRSGTAADVLNSSEVQEAYLGGIRSDDADRLRGLQDGVKYAD
jgi:branched-chain amino acid transport system ATP-binding protein